MNPGPDANTNGATADLAESTSDDDDDDSWALGASQPARPGLFPWIVRPQTPQRCSIRFKRKCCRLAATVRPMGHHGMSTSASAPSWWAHGSGPPGLGGDDEAQKKNLEPTILRSDETRGGAFPGTDDQALLCTAST